MIPVTRVTLTGEGVPMERRNRYVRDDQVARSEGLESLPGARQLGGGAKYVEDQGKALNL